VSRFDFPAFNLTKSDSPASTTAPSADPNTTASLPVPQESVYSPGGADTRIARRNLPPPPAYSIPPSARRHTTPASYSPIASGRPKRHQTQPLANEAYADPPRVQPGGGRRIIVAKGDTLAGLSRRYGVPVEAIQSANNLADGRLVAGQELVIPGSGAVVAAAKPAPTQATPYKVQKGDTPHGIAEKFGISEKALLEQNKTVRPETLQIGQVLMIPGSAKKADVAEAAATAPGVRVVKTTTIPAPGSAPAKEEGAAASKPEEIAASPEITGEGLGKGGADAGKPETSQIASTDQLPAPDPMSGNSFRWPVKGRIVSEFGTKPDGGHNDGIDVAVPQGTSVKAAENGVVAYAGSELKGYGNLVLIRHSNNWVSAYAHNEEILVKRGDKVRRGQIIAKAGATGSVNQPQVHFELRKGSRPVDPTQFMSDAAASAD
jgi:murein DD-endopeptidase MepM/ murein hydrolase activator NlpD